MQIEVSQRSLRNSLERVAGVIGGKVTSSEVYNCIHIETIEDEIMLTGTDGDVTIMIPVAAKILKSGKAAVPSRKLLDIVKIMEDNELQIKLEQDKIILSTPKGKYKLASMDADLFPEKPQIKENYDLELPISDIDKMIERVEFAVSMDDPRPAFNGIFWKISDQGLEMVATDTHKLAYIKYQDKDEPIELSEPTSAIIPPKALRLLNKLEQEDETTLKIAIAENHICFKIENQVIYSNLIRGPYPEYQNVIPKGNDVDVQFETIELMNAVNRTATLSNAITHMVKFSISDGKTILHGLNVDSGDEANEEVACENSGADIDVSFNGEYIKTILRLIESDLVILKLNSAGGAALMLPENQSENMEFQTVIMPLKFTDF